MFRVKDYIFVHQGPLLYQARLIKTYKADSQQIDHGDLAENQGKQLPKAMMGEDAFLVHYLGWNKQWDEWVNSKRILPITQENSQLKKSLELQIKEEKESKAAKQLEKSSKKVQKGKNKQDKASLLVKGKRSINKNSVNDSGIKIKIKKPSYNNYKGFTHNEIIVLVPDSIKNILVDDWEKITKDNKLHALPANITAKTTLKWFESYLIEMYENDDETLGIYLEITESLGQYFSKALGTCLLYRYERFQYAEQMKLLIEGNDWLNIYGAMFLIRLMSIFPNIMTENNMNMDTIELTKKYLQIWWVWVDKMKVELGFDDYENQNPTVALMHT